MTRVGFVGWRGMVGSVLVERMLAGDGFDGVEPLFASTSQANGRGPDIGVDIPPLADAFDLAALSAQEIIVSCQGSDYTKKVHPALRESGWRGYWIDASSALRMEPSSVIVLDPVNRHVIDAALEAGTRDFIGGNCTVSLMLMGVAGLFRKGWVEWLTSMTYQAASGAGARYMRQLVAQMASIGDEARSVLEDPASAILELDRRVVGAMTGDDFPVDLTVGPLAGSALPWIDSAMETGQSREEWKGIAETNKILGNEREVPVDGICVRIGAMRCHAQALTIKLTEDIPLADIEAAIAGAHDWVEIVPNDKEATLARLTPAAVTGKLTVPVGRVRKLNMGPEYLTLFTVGDQLLWGAAEPLHRMLSILLERL